jgi:hypothetical protein
MNFTSHSFASANIDLRVRRIADMWAQCTLQLLPAAASALWHREPRVRHAACSLLAAVGERTRKAHGSGLADIVRRVVCCVLEAGGYAPIQGSGFSTDVGKEQECPGRAEDVQTCAALVSFAHIGFAHVLGSLLRVLPPASLSNLQLVGKVLEAMTVDGNGNARLLGRGDVAEHCVRWLLRACKLGIASAPSVPGGVLLDIEQAVMLATRALTRSVSRC